MGMEIERKWLLEHVPEFVRACPSKELTQGYLCTAPVVRVRQEGDAYYLTYKGSGALAREEYNLPLTREAFEKLLPKCDGIVLRKMRYYVPLNEGRTGLVVGDEEALSSERRAAVLPGRDGTTQQIQSETLTVNPAAEVLPSAFGICTISNELLAEVDVFHGAYEGRFYAEVEFPSEAAARSFTAPDWFGREVTGEPGYSNAELAMRQCPPELS